MLGKVGEIMNKFLDELSRNLKGNIPDSYVKSNIDYYREYIMGEKEKGRGEKEIIAQLGEPRLIAKNIINTCPLKNHNNKSGYYEEYNDKNNEYYDKYNEENNKQSDSRMWGFNRTFRTIRFLNKLTSTRIGRVFATIGMFLIMVIIVGLIIVLAGLFFAYVLPVIAIVILVKMIIAAIRGK